MVLRVRAMAGVWLGPVLLLLVMVGRATSDVVVKPWHKDSITLEDVEATFGLAVPNRGLRGKLYIADPLDACLSQSKRPPSKETSPFLVIESGGCHCTTKVRHAQAAGYMVVLLYNKEDEPKFVTMEGNATDISIYAVSITRLGGMTLLREAEDPRTNCYLMPSADFSRWSRLEIAAFVFVSLNVVIMALFIFLCVRRRQLHDRQLALHSRPLLD